MNKKIKKGLVFGGFVGATLAVLFGCVFMPPEEEASATQKKNGMTLVWADEFDYNGKPDTSKWKYQTGAGGWGNNELQTYVDNSQTADTAEVSGGTLKIKAYYDNGWKSARMNSKKSFKYGLIEARLKVPADNGSWPAFWMMPRASMYGEWPASGEIDIMEHAPNTNGNGGLLNQVYSTLHFQNRHAGDSNGLCRETLSATTEFHTYAVLWEEDKISAYYDDKYVGSTYYNPNTTSADWPFDQDFYILLNMAMGGNLGGPIENTNTKIYEVDYVRVYQDTQLVYDNP